jgi:hypothetical protein
LEKKFKAQQVELEKVKKDESFWRGLATLLEGDMEMKAFCGGNKKRPGLLGLMIILDSSSFYDLLVNEDNPRFPFSYSLNSLFQDIKNLCERRKVPFTFWVPFVVMTEIQAKGQRRGNSPPNLQKAANDFVQDLQVLNKNEPNFVLQLECSVKHRLPFAPVDSYADPNQRNDAFLRQSVSFLLESCNHPIFYASSDRNMLTFMQNSESDRLCLYNSKAKYQPHQHQDRVEAFKQNLGIFMATERVSQHSRHLGVVLKSV